MKTSSPPALAILVATVFLVPLALAPSLQAFDITPKFIALILSPALVWYFLLLSGEFPRIPRKLALALAGLAVSGILATLFSTDIVISLFGAEWRRMGILSWLACLALAAAVPAAASNDRARRRVLAAIGLSGVLASIYGLAQYAGYDPWIEKSLYHIGEGEWQIVRPPSTLGYVSYFAMYAVAAMFVGVDLAASAATRAKQIAWSAGAGVIAIALLTTGSRGAWLGAAAGVAMLALRLPNRRAVLIGLLVVVAVSGLFVASPLGQPIRNRVRWFVEDPQGGVRLYLWRDSLRLAASHPLLGVGPDAFGRAIGRVKSVELSAQAPDAYIESPHNVLLDYLTSAGLPALACFVALIVLAVRRANVFLGAAIVGSFVTGQFIADTIPTRLVVLILVAIASSKEWSDDPNPRTRTIEDPVFYSSWLAFPLAFLLGFSARWIESDYALARAADAAKAGAVDNVIVEETDATRFHSFQYARLLGQLVLSPNIPASLRDGMLADSAKFARESLEHSEFPQTVHLHLASLAGLRGDYPQAQKELELATVDAPTWFRPHWQLAMLLAQQGHAEQAAVQAKLALECGAKSLPSISADLQRIAHYPR